ncbi:glycoside hydrolase family 47 protein [Hypoxylon trugodes]|uniref:glycoside hydrolase family 47 protein n=1 Tax=Hypoxylon trugodes TaxID=326681 RepID=UPI0021944400|nr:glycoside hydrolase family 47 protein [Hypoxylon trugodes]KAI1392776.1 glycoside hydrolase family 47 protein [Hypoxylon trugodes]
MGNWILAISRKSTNHGSFSRLIVPYALLLVSWLGVVESMRPSRIADLRQDTVDMFYHGFDNYMKIAFPEDELRPVSCTPLTRDPLNPRNIALNDVLGNYSLTLIDSLSSLAILASAPPDSQNTGPKALSEFRDGVAALVAQYGDGRSGPSGQGARGRGFDVDSKVQVFETVIRGVGGLLSAHLFAVGDLPIAGYEPRRIVDDDDDIEEHPIPWPNGFKYNGQLLRLALDLAQRLLPAFYTQTGLPYPRVNLRHGIPFYLNSPLHTKSNLDPKPPEDPEITETCSAGAGSLVLEFTVLSRLTGDPRFEQAAKRAFWAVWSRRSNIGLIGAGVDAEGGHWIGGFSGIGAGIDSFFEYALKTHILLSGHELPNRTMPLTPDEDGLDPNQIYRPLSDEDNSPDSFLQAWHHAHAAIKRHLYSGLHHPHYVNAHMSTGSPQAYWIDSLGAYYSGLLALAGELDEAIETHLVYSALWTRYSALPERWSVRDGNVEGGLGWWPGRPEFIESTYHLYRATRDPWYLYVGEMVLRDIKRRCWTKCGWSGLQDVRTGEKSDRMESFFLGETAKYLYLLFDPDHPLNQLDASYVFTTEGHPLIIPRKKTRRSVPKQTTEKAIQPYFNAHFTNTCPRPPILPPISGSAAAARPDLYNAATLIRLHQIPNIHSTLEDPIAKLGGSEGQTKPSENPRENYTYFPWTLPPYMLPTDGICAVTRQAQTSVIEFPSNAQQSVGSAFNIMFGGHNLVRMGSEGIMINSLSGLKLALLMEEPPETSERAWRVYSIGNLPLGRDEKVFISRDVLEDMSDPLFHRVRDSVIVDLLVQTEIPQEPPQQHHNSTSDEPETPFEAQAIELDADVGSTNLFSSFLQQITSALREPATTSFGSNQQSDELSDRHPKFRYIELPAITPVGVGAASLPDVREAPNPNIAATQLDAQLALSWQKVFFAGQACDGKLPDAAARQHQVVVMRRGGCSFSEKLANIPSFAPGKGSLQVVVVVSDDEDDGTGNEDEDEDEVGGESRTGRRGGRESDSALKFIRPLLDEPQTTPSGILRHRPIAMLMTGGGSEAYELLKTAKSVGMRRRYHVESQGLRIGNLVVL